jgi:protein-S-isoprenylcysteine O-methyltransferase
VNGIYGLGYQLVLSLSQRKRMTSVQLFWLLLASTWMLAEILLLRRCASVPVEQNLDRGSAPLLWAGVGLGLLLALLFKELRWLPLGLDGVERLAWALPLCIGGLVLRGLAVAGLGRHFSTAVSLQDGHSLICSGPYRFIRHPSYTGLLLAFVGAGLAMGDGLALAVLLLTTSSAVLFRIRVEEQALASHFQQDYLDYCAGTKKLLPWIY